MDEYLTASRLAAEEMEAYRDGDYELMCELQKKRSEVLLDHEEENDERTINRGVLHL